MANRIPSYHYQAGKHTVDLATSGIYSIDCLEKFPVNSFLVSTDNVLLFNNHNMANTLLSTPEELNNRSLKSIIPKNDLNQIIQHNAEVIRYNRTRHFQETMNINNDNERDHEFCTVKRPLYNSDQKIIGTYGISMSLSENSLTTVADTLIECGFHFGNQLTADKLCSLLECSIIKGVLLSKRETMCLYCMTRGFSARAIGDILYLSRRTVESHLVNVKEKLNCSSKTELILLALNSGAPYNQHIPIFPDKL